MYSLEYKQLHIVKDPMRKNCTTQSYRWKQAAVCDEREPLEEILKQKPDKDNWRISGYGRIEEFNGVIRLVAPTSEIDKLPTVDAVPVVRCKDCAWRYDDSDCLNPKCGKSWYGCPVTDEHYCSYGERRADDGE